jgi:hypothetical protein
MQGRKIYMIIIWEVKKKIETSAHEHTQTA